MSSISILETLPGYNCGRCGFPNCRSFAAALGDGAEVDDCPLLLQERYAENRARLVEAVASRPERPVELVGNRVAADVILAPLPGEPACREFIYPFDRDVRPQAGELVSYRCLGCPILHFAKVAKVDHSVLMVQVTGPLHRLGITDSVPTDIGICSTVAFEGQVVNDRIVEIGETVRFIPHRCMMQKVHSGVVVSSEGDKVRIENVDLKVWG
ncbi:(Fe-S)-binding protein [Methanomassiliicoccus luminyensis]|jgi:hypothetical protein|uniref:(Fe-S)-binding protein n=1 Tax=Methanomassiliicoccus luminyensis TaxID=1080712 RepID=UPI00038108B6|nr:(Fe-S)-binding protein [Methanomassiliicoccus luminyensis]